MNQVLLDFSTVHLEAINSFTVPAQSCNLRRLLSNVSETNFQKHKNRGKKISNKVK